MATYTQSKTANIFHLFWQSCAIDCWKFSSTAHYYPSSSNIVGNKFHEDWLYGYEPLLDAYIKYQTLIFLIIYYVKAAKDVVYNILEALA